MRRYIIFDLDGTLVDSSAICIGILQEMLEERGSTRQLDPAEGTRFMSLGGEQMVRALLGRECGDPVFELADFRARYSRCKTPAHSLFDGVPSGLRQLRRAGYELAICSNKPANLCTKVLDDTGLSPLFSVVVGGNTGLRPKPAPDLLNSTLAQLGVSADLCMFVGDSELDHEIAINALIPFFFMSYGYAEPGWRPDRGQTFAAFVDLVGHLLTTELSTSAG